MISFNVPPYIGEEDKYIKQAIESRKICGDGQWFITIFLWDGARTEEIER